MMIPTQHSIAKAFIASFINDARNAFPLTGPSFINEMETRSVDGSFSDLSINAIVSENLQSHYAHRGHAYVRSIRGYSCDRRVSPQ
ncbi:hypothetical protein PM082_006220 [Marasmius tenuissimus]|nr:hypothetical protein PM082_006220 [Marasmius tenuissimus]